VIRKRKHNNRWEIKYFTSDIFIGISYYCTTKNNSKSIFYSPCVSSEAKSMVVFPFA